jgi:hypothetical protein
MANMEFQGGYYPGTGGKRLSLVSGPYGICRNQYPRRRLAAGAGPASKPAAAAAARTTMTRDVKTGLHG